MQWKPLGSVISADAHVESSKPLANQVSLDKVSVEEESQVSVVTTSFQGDVGDELSHTTITPDSAQYPVGDIRRSVFSAYTASNCAVGDKSGKVIVHAFCHLDKQVVVSWLAMLCPSTYTETMSVSAVKRQVTVSCVWASTSVLATHAHSNDSRSRTSLTRVMIVMIVGD